MAGQSQVSVSSQAAKASAVGMVSSGWASGKGLKGRHCAKYLSLRLRIVSKGGNEKATQEGSADLLAPKPLLKETEGRGQRVPRGRRALDAPEAPVQR